ncbi:MAG: adenylosuccinate synthetase, partial [Chloroflexota bacterium]
PQAPITTPFHRAVNRLKELARGDSRHGSCGMGIGETMVDLLAHPGRVIRVGDMCDRDILFNKLRFVQAINQAKLENLLDKLPHHPQVNDELDILNDASWVDFLIEEYSEIGRQIAIVPEGYLTNLLNRDGAVIFEAAQGVLLDEWYGFHPHTTWSTTTLANAEQLLHEAHYDGVVERIGISRAYSTRHGAGPLVTEDEQLTQLLPDACNGDDAWQASFRSGWLDLVMFDYAVRVNGLSSTLDSLAITCLDRLQELDTLKVCIGYNVCGEMIHQLPIKETLEDLQAQEKLTSLLRGAQPIFEIVKNTDELLPLIEQKTGVPISILSEGPASINKIIIDPVKERVPAI